jgi:hypothetical protein
MLRNRVLTLLAGCLLLGSAALADDLGFVDCTTHPEETEIFAKARKSQDVVGNIPCGERFKIVLYGFIFSEIQTSDGKVGYVYSSILTVDRSGGTLQMRAARDAAPTMSATAEVTKIPADPKPAPAPVKRAAPVVAAATPAATAPASDTASANAAVATTAASTSADVKAAEAAPAPANAASPSADGGSASTLPAPAAVLAATDASKSDPNAADAASAKTASASAAQTESAAAEAAPAAGGTSAAAASNATEAATSDAANAAAATPASSAPPAAPAAEAPAPAATPAAAAAAPEPAPTPAPQPAPARVQPNAPSAKITTESWEKPNPGGKNTSLLEFFGGFAYSRMNEGGGVSNNFLGGVGAFGVNVRSWLQISGDSSYNYYDVTGAKYVLYGNHYGPRIFWRRHNPLHRFFGVTPFGEALFGGSREDIHWPATGGNSAYTTSTNGFSWKVGGGVDLHTSRMFEIRLIDVDYYRTPFGGTTQSNYWISTGIVLRLFKGWSD